MSLLASMTGFAREAGTLPDGTSFVWELRSVNGRGLDLRLRLPPGLDALEPALRDAMAKRLKRGNVSAGLALRREERAPRLTPTRRAGQRSRWRCWSPSRIPARVAARRGGASLPGV